MRIGINDFYRYVLGGAAKINLDKVPDAFKEKRQLIITNTIGHKFRYITCNSHFSSVLRTNLRVMGKTDLETILFRNTTDTIQLVEANQYTLPVSIDDETIISNFIKLNEKYQFYPACEIKAMESRFLMFFRTFRLYIDCNDFGKYSNDDVALQVYKLIALFGISKGLNPFRNIERYIRVHFSNNIVTPIHDITLYNLPVNKPILKLPQWQAFIYQHGRKAQYIFQCAPVIEKSLGRVPANIEQAFEAYSIENYKRWQEYPELARLCASYFIPEYIFNDCLALEKERKQSDLLPEVRINGNGKSVGHANYCFIKLPVDDPHAYVLGHITNCCQSIGGASESCVIDGIKNENAGFYVLLKKTSNSLREPVNSNGKINYEDYAIIGQGFAWLSVSGNLTFDSWENLRATDNDIAVDFLREFGKTVTSLYPGIARVTIGLGGKTPAVYRDKPVNNPEKVKSDLYNYADSLLQGLIYQNEEKMTKKKINCLIGREHDIVIPVMSKEDIQVIESAISALKQREILEELLLHESSRTLWPQLLGNDYKTFPDLITLIKKNGLIVLEIAWQLRQYGVLTHTFWDFIMCQCLKSDQNAVRQFLDDVVYLLNELTAQNVLNEKYILLAMASYSARPPYPPNLDALLSEGNKPYIMRCLRNNRNSSALAISFIELFKVNMINDETIIKLIDHSEHAWLLALEILRLNAAKRLNVDTFELLMRNPLEAGNIVDQLLLSSTSQLGLFAKREDSVTEAILMDPRLARG